VGHLRMMNSTLPITCIARWFLTGPPRLNFLRSPSSRGWRPWFLPRAGMSSDILAYSHRTQLRAAKSCLPPPLATSLGRAGQAQAPTKVYPVGRIVETRFRDRDSLYEVQGPAPSDRAHQERGHRKEDTGCHASAQRGTQASPRAPAARLTRCGGSWGAGQRELAELTGASAGCRCGRLRRMLGTHL
jgi:hypothetical protein